jgi:hypothetical protein
MAVWIGIVIALVVIIAGGSWQTWRLAGGARGPARRSLRARRAAIWRRRRAEAAEADGGEADDGR